MRRSTAVLLFVVGALCVVCVALLVLLLAPDWRLTGGHTSGHGSAMPLDATPPGSPYKVVAREYETVTSSSTSTASTTPKEPWEREYRIPTTTIPHHYDLYLHPDLEEGDFTGRVTILIGVTSPMSYLVAHVKKLNVTSTSLLKEGGRREEVPLGESFEYAPNEFWVVRPRDTLPPGNYSLTLHFSGTLTGSIVGFYRSMYTTSAGEKR